MIASEVSICLGALLHLPARFFSLESGFSINGMTYSGGGRVMGPLWVARAGFELLVSIFAGALAGYWFDRKTGNRFFPLFSLTGFLLGSAAGMLLVYRAMQSGDRSAGSVGEPDPGGDEVARKDGKDRFTEKESGKD